MEALSGAGSRRIYSSDEGQKAAGPESLYPVLRRMTLDKSTNVTSGMIEDEDIHTCQEQHEIV